MRRLLRKPAGDELEKRTWTARDIAPVNRREDGGSSRNILLERAAPAGIRDHESATPRPLQTRVRSGNTSRLDQFKAIEDRGVASVRHSDGSLCGFRTDGGKGGEIGRCSFLQLIAVDCGGRICQLVVKL
jgi:hypothetical protein